MQFFKIFSAAMLMATVSVGAVQAKGLRDSVPTEFPPSSYKGKQYIDSKGCVFIRAGFSGNVTWVPRVARSRKQICGQRPTFAKAPTPNAPVVADAPVAKPAVKPVRTRVAAPKPAPKRVVRVPAAPIAKPVVRTAVVAPTPAPVRAPKRIARRVVRTPVAVPVQPVVVPQPVIVAAPVVVQQPVVRQVTYPTYQTTTRTPRTRTRRVATPKPTRAQALAAATPSNTVLEQRLARIAPPTKPPEGYVAAWSDDRQNPNRARGTAAGKAQMEMVWTNTVPSRLVAVSTSQDTLRRVVVRVQREDRRQATVLSTKSRRNLLRSEANTGGNR